MRDWTALDCCMTQHLHCSAGAKTPAAAHVVRAGALFVVGQLRGRRKGALAEPQAQAQAAVALDPLLLAKQLVSELGVAAERLHAGRLARGVQEGNGALVGIHNPLVAQPRALGGRRVRHGPKQCRWVAQQAQSGLATAAHCLTSCIRVCCSIEGTCLNRCSAGKASKLCSLSRLPKHKRKLTQHEHARSLECQQDLGPRRQERAAAPPAAQPAGTARLRARRAGVEEGAAPLECNGFRTGRGGLCTCLIRLCLSGIGSSTLIRTDSDEASSGLHSACVQRLWLAKCRSHEKLCAFVQDNDAARPAAKVGGPTGWCHLKSKAGCTAACERVRVGGEGAALICTHRSVQCLRRG